jgi:hypothetical protein
MVNPWQGSFLAISTEMELDFRPPAAVVYICFIESVERRLAAVSAAEPVRLSPQVAVKTIVSLVTRPRMEVYSEEER